MMTAYILLKRMKSYDAFAESASRSTIENPAFFLIPLSFVVYLRPTYRRAKSFLSGSFYFSFPFTLSSDSAVVETSLLFMKVIETGLTIKEEQFS